MDSSKLLVLKNLSVWYTQGKPVLDNFSIELNTNEVVGLIGLNGAGKTTFIKTLSGLLGSFRVETALWQDRPLKFRDREFIPTSDKIFQFLPVIRRVSGRHATGRKENLTAREYKKERYVVFAEDRSFQFFTFREYISYVGASYGKKLSDIEELVRGFQFEEYTDVLLKELSTGNLKKAYLITAFALKPKLLLLDEPVNGLDFQSTEYLYQQIGGYRQYGTVLFSSHILESICLTSDRVLVLEQGQIKKCYAGQEIETGKIREALKV